MGVVRFRLALVLILVVSVIAVAQEPVPTIDGPLTPDKAPQSFRLEPGLKIELVAGEPLVVSPVAVAFDERGRMFVAENRGYPTGPGEGQPPIGRVALLEDTNGDGRMDKRSEFAEGLTFPNGLLPWKGGLIVTCAPEILYLKDTNGDGVADEKSVLFTGFSTSGSTQLRVSHPTLSLDGWVYVTSGLTGGKVTSPSDPNHPPVELKRTDFRFRPDLSQWEGVDGGAQFGMSFDDFGRRFICYNRVQVQHVVLSSDVLRRNPHLAFSETVQNCPADVLAEPLKGHGVAAKLFPISQNVTTADSHAGSFTAACAVTVWKGASLPDVYKGGVFSCDPTGNLVHFDKLEPNGATFAARRMRDNIEFLSSSDNWFRPVYLAGGPEGGLYVCDMYRKTIEHPDYLPVEIRKHTDFESGKTMGRVWRVVRDDAAPADLEKLRRTSLDGASVTELCDALKSADGWRRSTAHRLLMERADPASAAPVKALALDPASPPATVVGALALLEQWQAVDPSVADAARNHPAPGVREYSLRLPLVRKDLTPLLGLAHDADPRVRFEAAIALGSSTDSVALAALADVLAASGTDRWTRAAVFSSLHDREFAFLPFLLSQKTPMGRDVAYEFGKLLGASQPAGKWPLCVAMVTQKTETRSPAPEVQTQLLTGFGEALRGRVTLIPGQGILASALGPLDQAVPERNALAALFNDARALSQNSEESPEKRKAAIEFLALADFNAAGEGLLALIDPATPAELQAAAVRALGTFRDDRIAAKLLEADRFRTYSPLLRDEVLGAMLSHAHHLPGLLAALEDGRVPVVAIDAIRRRQLTGHRDAAIKSRAEKLFGAVSADRAKVYEDYKEVVTWKADASRGREIFKKICAQCHRLDREGYAVGPDLFSIRNQPKESILLHVLVPDHEITQGFGAYVVALNDGRTLTGLIVADTPTSITLRQPQAKEDTILRSDIEELVSSRLSLMPQGLEKNVNKQEMADLLAYLKGEK